MPARRNSSLINSASVRMSSNNKMRRFLLDSEVEDGAADSPAPALAAVDVDATKSLIQHWMPYTNGFLVFLKTASGNQGRQIPLAQSGNLWSPQPTNNQEPDACK